MYWKVLHTDGTSHQTGGRILHEDVDKEVSVDHLDRDTVSQLLVCDDNDLVIYSLPLSQEFRAENKFIHRRTVGMDAATGDTQELYHLVGYNNKQSGVTLVRVYPDGHTQTALPSEVTLHQPELF